MKCDEIQTNLSAYRDDEGSPLRRWRVRVHLKDCADCRRALQRLNDLCALLEPGPAAPELPSGFALRVMAQARQHQEDNPIPLAAHPSRWAQFVYPLVAAAGILLVGVGSGLLLSDSLWSYPAPTAEVIDSRATIEPFREAPPYSLSAVYPSLGDLSAD